MAIEKEKKSDNTNISLHYIPPMFMPGKYNSREEKQMNDKKKTSFFSI